MTLLLALALQACSAFGIEDDGSEFWIELAGDGNSGNPGGEAVRVNNSPHDPRGMAGIEVEVTGIDGLPPTLTLTAADFQKSPSRDWETRLPDSGHVGFVVRLRDRERQLVAEKVSGSFTIMPRTIWRLRLERSPLRGNEIQEPKCPDPWWRCDELWMLSIREDARNYPSEVLWVMLYRRKRSSGCPKDTVCM